MRLVVDAEVAVGVPDRLPDGGLDERLAREPAANAGGSAIERHAHGEVRVGSGRRSGLVLGAGLRQHVIAQEAAHHARLLLGATGADGQPDAANGGGDREQQEAGGGRQPNAMLPHEFPHAIRGRWWRRVDRFALQVPLQVARQPVDRLVTIGAILLERLERDPVELAVQLGR